MNTPSNHETSEYVSEALRAMQLDGPVKLLDLLPTGVQVNDLNGLIVYANERHCQTLGLAREEVVGKLHIWDVVKHEKDANFLTLYLRFLIENTPKPTVYFGLNKGRDGEGLPVKVEWDYIRDPSNKVVGFISLVQPHPSW